MPIVAPKKSRKKIKEQSRIQKLSRSRVRGIGRGLIASFLPWMERNNARETYGTGARVNRGAHCFAIGWRNCRNFEGGMDREIASPVIDCSITFSASACRVAPANESLFPLSPFFTPSPLFSAGAYALLFFFPLLLPFRGWTRRCDQIGKWCGSKCISPALGLSVRRRQRPG